MNVSQLRWTQDTGWTGDPDEATRGAQLVLVFGGGGALQNEPLLRHVRETWPEATLLGCSTAGEIADVEVTDDGLVATAVRFERTRLRVAETRLEEVEGSREAGVLLGRELAGHDLVHVFVLSDGTEVNGSELVEGLAAELPAGVTVTGGLSGDGARFERTLVLSGEELSPRTVVALGLYGDSLRVGCASLGGWDPFGPERLVTRSEGNVLYELDGRSALELYKTYLGDEAAGLPATGLLFPLAVRLGDEPVVRTILGIDETTQSLTFAGDVPEGAHARLMKANFERLVEGAAGAARVTQHAAGHAEPELAILISCVGRKMVLQQRIEEEVEAVRDVLGSRPVLTGFYSYGEISPFTPEAKCELHNQTMTITAFSEA